MPAYDYTCPKCADTRTVTLSIKDTEVTQVCKCGETMARRYGIAAVTFKGSGFASTDKQ